MLILNRKCCNVYLPAYVEICRPKLEVVVITVSGEESDVCQFEGEVHLENDGVLAQKDDRKWNRPRERPSCSKIGV